MSLLDKQVILLLGPGCVEVGNVKVKGVLDFDNSRRQTQESSICWNGVKLGRWNFVYTEGERKLTLPVEMLMRGDSLWELSSEAVKAWDPPFEGEQIDQPKRARILERIERFVELTGKKVRIY